MTTSIGRNSGSTATPTKATFSYWLKGKADGTAQGIWGWHRGNDASNYWLGVYYSTNDSMYFNWKQGSFTCTLGTMQKFRDSNAWGHHVISIDTTLNTVADRVKWYVNGERITSFEDGLDTITQNQTLLNWSNSNDKIEIGTWYQASSAKNLNNHLLSHFHFTDGYAYQASDFGSTDSTTGQWKINTSPSVTYGNEGFFILKDGNTITDSSTNSNNFSLDGGTLTKTEDCPSNVFPTINPLNYQLSGCALGNGNTSLASTGGNGWRTMHGTLAGSTGKFYWEQKINGYAGSSHYIGITDIDEASNNNSNDFELGGVSSYCYRADGGKVTSVSGSTVLTAGVGASFTTNDIIGIAMDLDNQKIYFSKNGTWQNSGDPTSGATGTGSFFNITAGKLYTPATATYDTSQLFSYNFGNGYFATSAVSSAGTNASGIGIFEYDVPTGYTSLSTKGLNL